MARAASRRRPFSGIRPIDPVRDARGVVRLIEEAFGGELSPVAQKALRDLHRLSRTAWLLGPLLWMTPFADLFSGFVWAEGRQVVGNVTVTKSRGGGPGCWLVSNVVVDPAYRRRGIARALIEEALAHVRSRNGHRIILQVRADNQAAVHLYRDMGFVAVDTLLEMRLPPESSVERTRNRASRIAPHAQQISLRLRPRGYDEWSQEYLLAREGVPAAAQRMRPLERSHFEVAWDERIFRWFGNWLGSVREYRLGIEEEGALRATLTVWAGRWRPYHRLEIRIHPDYHGQWEEGLVDHALALLRGYPCHPVHIEVHAVHDALVRTLEGWDFVIDRELVQMELDLAKEPGGARRGACGRSSSAYLLHAHRETTTGGRR